MFYRVRGAKSFEPLHFELPGKGQVHREQLPAVGTQKDTALEIYLTAFDKRGNEVFLWGAAHRPREVILRTAQSDAWYDRWWVWTLIGGAVAAGAGAAVFGATREPGPTVPLGFETR